MNQSRAMKLPLFAVRSTKGCARSRCVVDVLNICGRARARKRERARVSRRSMTRRQTLTWCSEIPSLTPTFDDVCRFDECVCAQN